MFVKSREPESPVPPQQPQQQAPQAKRPVGRNGVPSIISADLIVRGTLFSAGDVQIDGKVDGDIRAGGLVIGEKATIVGDVYADEAVIRGRVEGGISARKVQLCSTCHVEGNILHEALSVEIGAYFEGNCRHSENPLANAPENVAATERRQAAAAPQAAAPPPPRPQVSTLPPPSPAAAPPKPAAVSG
jgi:cytoskeletal protein CcmA (bactofilin family)